MVACFSRFMNKKLRNIEYLNVYQCIKIKFCVFKKIKKSDQPFQRYCLLNCAKAIKKRFFEKNALIFLKKLENAEHL